MGEQTEKKKTYCCMLQNPRMLNLAETLKTALSKWLHDHVDVYQASSLTVHLKMVNDAKLYLIHILSC
jgi:hypothetical protein